jgi:AcrR family transcriptional regulator
MAVAGLRERKKAATRLAISRAALKVAVERGVNGLTTDAIAEAADVAPRTFRNYFASKEDALLYVLDEFERRLVEALRLRDPAEPVLDSLEAAVIAIIESAETELSDWIAVSRMIVLHPTLRAHYAATYDHTANTMLNEIAQRTGTDPAVDVYPRIVCHSTYTVLRATLEMHADGGGTRSQVPDAIRRGFTHVRSGLAQPALQS